ncbi:MAG: DUF3068 domain-containing protein [Chloroflexi bacterium]|nr:DUF3068 domain-containing protein [Chloroflexota bacterium]
MNRRSLGALLFLLGLAIVAAGVVLMLVIVPGMKRFPDDVDTTRQYEGTLATMLNPADFTFLNDLPVTIERHVTVQDTDGDLALVREEQVMSAGDQTLQNLTKSYAIDRETMESVASGYPDAWSEEPGFWPREGLVIGWPIDSEPESYRGWSDDYRQVVTLDYDSEVIHDRSDLTTYYYVGSGEAQPIAPEAAQAMGLPMAIPKDALIDLIGQTDLPALIQNALPGMLDAWEGDVPLDYFYAYEAEYWVEPTTGVLIDTRKHDLRTVTLGQEVVAGSPLAALPEENRAALRVPVFDLTYQAVDSAVADAKADAEENIDRLNLFGRYIPIGLEVVGALIALLGLFWVIRG